MNEDIYVKILEKEMIPALGCTDPVGIAYAPPVRENMPGVS